MDFDFKKVGLFIAAFAVVLVFLFNASNYNNVEYTENCNDSLQVNIDTLVLDTISLDSLK